MSRSPLFSLVAMLAVGIAGCPAEAPPPEEDPRACTPDNHCLREDGQLVCEPGYTWQDPDEAGNYVCVPADDENLNEGVDCNEQDCVGLFWCHFASGECRPGCAETSQCGTNEVCQVSSHECACGTGTHRCEEACVSDDDVATCGGRCSPCPSDPNGTAVCRAGQCGFECADGFRECASGCCPRECSTGERRCAGDRVQTCGSDGAWVDGALCDTSCRDGACTECAPGAESCDWSGETDVRQLCSAEGAWAAAEDCPAGCYEPDSVYPELRCYACTPGDVMCGASGTELCTSEGQPEPRSSLTFAEVINHYWSSEVCGDITVRVDMDGAGFAGFTYRALTTGTLHVVNSQVEAGDSCPRVLRVEVNGAEVYASDPNAIGCQDQSYSGAVTAGAEVMVRFSNPGTACSSDCRDLFTTHVWVD